MKKIFIIILALINFTTFSQDGLLTIDGKLILNNNNFLYYHQYPSVDLQASFSIQKTNGSGDLINLQGGANAIYVSGSGLDAIYDFSGLGDERLNKNSYINNAFSLPEYYDSTYQSEIYFDTGNPYYWKLKDFHYRYLELQFTTLSNIFFAKTTYLATILQSVDELLIYSKEKINVDLRDLYSYIHYNLPIPTFVTEDIPRLDPFNNSVSYTGNILTVGATGTYSTLTAAYNAAVNGDILDVANETFDMANEPSGYWLINSVKSVLVRGNGSTVLNTETSTTDQAIRIRQTGTLKFEDLKIISDRRFTVFADVSNYVNNSVVIFENTDLRNNSTVANVAVYGQAGSASNDSYTEIIDSRLQTYYGHIFIPSTSNNNGYLYVQNSKGYINTTTAARIYQSSSTLGNYIYDCGFYQKVSNTILQIGTDTDQPTINYSCDIRNTKVKFLGNSFGHGILLGRGTNDVYCVNNISNSLETSDISSIGFVIKSIGTQLSDCIIKGNYSKNLRPFYIKGGEYNDLQYNIGINNSPYDPFSGFEFTNAIHEVELNSNNNRVINNAFYGDQLTMTFYEAGGAEDVKTTANTCLFDYNKYYTYNQDIWSLVGGIGNIEFTNKSTLWTGVNDASSTWERIVTQDKYIGE